MPSQQEHLSKFLSLVLRHSPETIGIELDPQGWAEVDDLIARASAHGKPYTRELIAQIVATSDKQRFRLSDDGQRIRANQGHSIAVDLALAPVTPPDELFHGTATRFLASIREQGLLKQARQHVHLSSDEATAIKVGKRHGQVIVLRVSAGALHRAGHLFYRSENGVWLTDHVPPPYLIFPQ